MRLLSHIIISAAAALSSLVLCGCGTPAGAILSPSGPAPVWPPAPETARLRYLGEIRADRDLKPARNFCQHVGDTLFGDAEARVMTSPLAVCTDGASRVFVADSNARAIHVFDLDTREYAVWSPPEDGFATPVSVTFDPSGRVLVSDSTKACIFTFDLAGKFTGTLGLGVLKRPCGAAIGADGRIFVADVGAHQIIVFSREGEEVGRVGERGSELGKFNYPTNLVFDHAGQLYVSDSLNFRVQVFSPELKFIRKIGSKGDVPGCFSQPKGLAVDADDHVYVVDANFEAVQVFDREGSLLMSFGREGRGPGEFWLPAGIHIDANGRVWIADSYNQRVQVFEYLREGVGP